MGGDRVERVALLEVVVAEHVGGLLWRRLSLNRLCRCRLLLRLGLVGRQADTDDFRLGEADGSDCHRVMDATLAGDDLGD